MPNFHAFLQTKYPLYSDTEIKVNLTVQQLCELVEEWGKSKAKKPIKTCYNCKHFTGSYCNLLKCYMAKNEKCSNHKLIQTP